MGATTEIAWCDATFNPWIGCTKVSDACDHCYAETLAKRYGWAKWGAKEPRKMTSPANWRKPYQWDREAKAAGIRKRVFCASLADVFDAEVDDEWRVLLLEMILATPNLDWLLLTKRPQVAKKFFDGIVPRNVWLGVTVENQKIADLRIPILLSIPARIRFLSCEPLLERIFVPRYGVSWIICGGESGGGARGMPLEWARSLRDQCADGNIPFFMKQLSQPAGKHFKDFSAFPADLQIREFPSAEAARAQGQG